MPELDFKIDGVEAVERGLTPLLCFKLRISHAPGVESVQAVLLHVQIQLRPAQRGYAEREKERLIELFGRPEQWGQTLRNKLWAHVDVTVPAFARETAIPLLVPCTFDLNLASAKYFHALEDGDISLLFLFSGSLFFAGPEGRLQTQRISWEKECDFAFPVRIWRELMDRHYPNCAWLYLQRDVFDRLYDYKLRHGLPTWDRAIEHLLASAPAEVEAIS